MIVPDSVVQPFYLTGSPEHSQPLIRGRLVRIFDPVSAIFARHDYPDIVSGLCAETVALAGCLAATLKFDGVFTVQAKGNQLVKTLFADVTSDGHIRAYASFDEDGIAGKTLNSPAQIDGLLGEGYIAFTVDQDASVSGEKAHRYQGIVELAGETLGDAAMAWFANSEQVDSHIVAAAGRHGDDWVATALMVQRVAADGGNQTTASRAEQDDAWTTADMLLRSVTREELVDPQLAPEDLVFRLFNALRPHVAPAQPVQDKCRCSPEKVEAVLSRMSPEELAGLVAESGKVEVTCEFCKTMRAVDPGISRH